MDWQLIGFHLELTKADIVAVDEDYRTAEQKRVEMLGKWKEKFAFKATYRAFVEALLSCGKASDAIEVCKAIASGNLFHDTMSYVVYPLTCLSCIFAGVEAPAEEKVMFNRSMSEEDFFEWLKSKGIGEKDCNTLSGN